MTSRSSDDILKRDKKEDFMSPSLLEVGDNNYKVKFDKKMYTNVSLINTLHLIPECFYPVGCYYPTLQLQGLRSHHLWKNDNKNR